MTRPDKHALIAALTARVADELGNVRESQRAAQEGATHEETRQEDPKDTRAIEAQYVSRGLAERVEGLQDALAVLRRLRLDTFDGDAPVALSALVGLIEGTQEKLYFLVPVAGGELLQHGETTVRTLTPHSPLGHALLNLHVDDDVELNLPGRRMHARIGWIA